MTIAGGDEENGSSVGLRETVDEYLDRTESLIPVRELLLATAKLTIDPTFVRSIAQRLILDTATASDLLTAGLHLAERLRDAFRDDPAATTDPRNRRPLTGRIDQILADLDRAGGLPDAVAGARGLSISLADMLGAHRPRPGEGLPGQFVDDDRLDRWRSSAEAMYALLAVPHRDDLDSSPTMATQFTESISAGELVWFASDDAGPGEQLSDAAEVVGWLTEVIGRRGDQARASAVPLRLRGFDDLDAAADQSPAVGYGVQVSISESGKQARIGFDDGSTANFVENTDQIGLADQPGPVLSPVEDERRSFEAVWSIVERASESGRLSGAIDDEIRTLNKLLTIVRSELDPDRYADLFAQISRRLTELLPDVVEALLNDIEVPRSIRLAAHGAPVDDQLDAIAEDLEAAADVLEAAVIAIDDEPDRPAPQVPRRPDSPYLNRTVHRLNHVFSRVDATYGALTQTRTGRRLLHSVGGAVAGVATAVATPIDGAISTGTATLIGTIASWIYTTIRRDRAELPARNLAHDERDESP